MEPRVVDVPERSRFEILVDGELAGFSDYSRSGDEISITHTEVDPAFEGQGIGSRLVRAMLDAARAQKLAVLPYCPFTKGWIAKHPEYTDLVPEDRRAQFGL
jgi:predicted GNAT family acetyltransferase